MLIPHAAPERNRALCMWSPTDAGVATMQVRVPKSIPVEPEVTEIPIADGDDGTIDI